MITKVTGKLLEVAPDQVLLEIDAFQYQVMIPEFTRRQLQQRAGQTVSLFTIQYLEGNPSQGRLTPRLVGFTTAAEREFFEMFCSVDGVGVKKALRAMVRPVPEVAILIEEQDAKGLASLPGVGASTAERIIAKLRRKMPKFALMVSQGQAEPSQAQPDVVREAFDLLRSLGHSESDARKLIDAALEKNARYKDVEALLQAIYQHSHGRT